MLTQGQNEITLPEPRRFATVYIVDDDAAVRDSLSLLLETAELRAECYDSAEAFLAAYGNHGPACIVLDLRMQAMSGLDLQAELVRRGVRLPIIFLTAHGDIPTTVQAMKAGAVDFLTKPVDGTLLLAHIRAAIARSEWEREREAARAAARARLASLTEREREVLAFAIAGQPNKEIARRLGISHRTVEVHRSSILSKTGTTTLLELSRIAAAGELPGSKAIAAVPEQAAAAKERPPP
jgi:FixJ family two-component response regulator